MGGGIERGSISEGAGVMIMFELTDGDGWVEFGAEDVGEFVDDWRNKLEVVRA